MPGNSGAQRLRDLPVPEALPAPAARFRNQPEFSRCGAHAQNRVLLCFEREALGQRDGGFAWPGPDLSIFSGAAASGPAGRALTSGGWTL